MDRILGSLWQYAVANTLLDFLGPLRMLKLATIALKQIKTT